MKRTVLIMACAALLAAMLGGCLATAPRSQGYKALEAEDYEQAAAYYAEAVKMEPQFWKARVRYGYALLRSGKVEQALEQFRQTIRMQGHSTARHWAVFYAGLCEAWLGRAGNAVAYWGGYSHVDWTLTSVVREAARTLADHPEQAGESFARQTLEKMEHAQAQKEKYDRAHILGGKGHTESNDSGDAELQVWEEQTQQYLP